jgi:hypothetical protein
MLNTTARATRATRPLIEYPAYFQRVYCDDCMDVHMCEIARSGQIICHGENYYFAAQTARTHYSRRLGKGFELVPITTPAALPLEWQMIADLKEPEYIDEYQDW